MNGAKPGADIAMIAKMPSAIDWCFFGISL